MPDCLETLGADGKGLNGTEWRPPLVVYFQSEGLSKWSKGRNLYRVGTNKTWISDRKTFCHILFLEPFKNLHLSTFGQNFYIFSCGVYSGFWYSFQFSPPPFLPAAIILATELQNAFLLIFFTLRKSNYYNFYILPVRFVTERKLAHFNSLFQF